MRRAKGCNAPMNIPRSLTSVPNINISNNLFHYRNKLTKNSPIDCISNVKYFAWNMVCWGFFLLTEMPQQNHRNKQCFMDGIPFLAKVQTIKWVRVDDIKNQQFYCVFADLQLMPFFYGFRIEYKNCINDLNRKHAQKLCNKFHCDSVLIRVCDQCIYDPRKYKLLAHSKSNTKLYDNNCQKCHQVVRRARENERREREKCFVHKINRSHMRKYGGTIWVLVLPWEITLF